MNWLEITVNTTPERLDSLTDALEQLGVEGLIVDDEQTYDDFFENNTQYWDYIDEELQARIKGVCRVRFYLEASEAGSAELERLRKALPDDRLETAFVQDEDWENNWKAYYKPMSVGNRLMIVPEWENAEIPEGRVPLRLDPGLIFGTGSHPTTRMCLEELESLAEGQQVLDLGCGSGILAIASLLLGAEAAVGCDIDPAAPHIALENAAMNGISGDRFEVLAGDILTDKQVKASIGSRRYGLVLANIVADVIIALAPAIPLYLAEDGTFIVSGIIDGREAEVTAALEAAGLTVLRHHQTEDWHCFAGCLSR